MQAVNALHLIKKQTQLIPEFNSSNRSVHENKQICVNMSHSNFKSLLDFNLILFFHDFKVASSFNMYTIYKKEISVAITMAIIVSKKNKIQWP